MVSTAHNYTSSYEAPHSVLALPLVCASQDHTFNTIFLRTLHNVVEENPSDICYCLCSLWQSSNKKCHESLGRINMSNL